MSDFHKSLISLYLHVSPENRLEIGDQEHSAGFQTSKRSLAEFGVYDNNFVAPPGLIHFSTTSSKQDELCEAFDG